MNYNNDILLKLKDKNKWWLSDQLINEDDKLRELEVAKYPCSFSGLEKINLREPGIYTVRGIRQIGKSTSIKKMIKKLLLDDGVVPQAVFYFSCDGLHKHEQLYSVLDVYLSEIAPVKQQLYIFIDEVTFVDEWQRAIKELADDGRLKNSTVLLTGSNILDLKKSSELLPGRRGKSAVHDVFLTPLSFKEFVQLIEPELSNLSFEFAIKRLNDFQELFSSYLLCGGIPLAINEYYGSGNKTISSFVYETYRNWILGDILKAGKSQAIFESVVAYLLKSLTTPVSWYKIGKEAHLMSHVTAMDYVELLERMFVVKKLELIDLKSKKPVFRKNKKFFFNDPLIFDAIHALDEGLAEESWSCARQWIDDPVNISKKVEQLVVSDLAKKNDSVFYWLGEKELDAVVRLPGKKLSFHEIKYQGRVSAKEFSWFENKFKNEKLTVYTKRDYEVNKNITCIPACLGLMGYAD